MHILGPRDSILLFVGTDSAATSTTTARRATALRILLDTIFALQLGVALPRRELKDLRLASSTKDRTAVMFAVPLKCRIDVY